MQNENATIVTLAVLPFENLSESKEMDIFRKSFCIELITELSRFRQFQIISYQSVKDLISDDKVVNESFSRLNTDYFIQGSFRIDNGLIRAKDTIEWAAKINPYRGETKLRPFWNYITDGNISLTRLEMPSTAAQNDLYNGFRKEGDLWKMSFSGATVQLPEVKGFPDIQKLLSQPRRPVHCAELMGNVLSAQGEPLLDEKAKKSYQGKILQIQQEMEWAEERNDFKRLKPSILAINTCWPADMSN
jgi:hypothetical protein